MKSRKRDYLFEIGDTFENAAYGKIKITNKIRITGSHNVKGYEYECLICGNVDRIRENDLKNHSSCNVCSGKKVLKGFNDLWTTRPDIAKLLKDSQRGYELTTYSHSKEDFVCGDCGYINKIMVSNVTRRGFSCTGCSDGISYPEKFMNGVLRQLNFEYERQKSFEWSGKKFYDFYISDKNCIIEVHGLQHYEEGFKDTDNMRTLKFEIRNDEYKENIARKNGIENYIIIDCSKSDIEFIKENILQSDLIYIFNLTTINWDECHELACKSTVREVCDIWNSGITNIDEICRHIKLGRCTVIKYLKQGSKLGWSNYNPKEVKRISMKKNHENRKRKVIQISKQNELIKIWDSIREASIELNIDETSINKTCKGVYKTSGGFKWVYKD